MRRLPVRGQVVQKWHSFNWNGKRFKRPKEVVPRKRLAGKSTDVALIQGGSGNGASDGMSNLMEAADSVLKETGIRDRHLCTGGETPDTETFTSVQG